MNKGVTITVDGKLGPSVKGAFDALANEGKKTAQKITAEQAKAYSSYWTGMVNSTGHQRAIEKSNAAVESASKRMFTAIGSESYKGKATIKAERDALAQAIRAHRELRDERGKTARNAEINASIAAGSMPANLAGWASARNRGGGQRGFGGGFGGAASAMFVSVARDTAASLASGANPMTVLMQQGPQVAQAFTMMGSSIGKFLLPAGLAAAAIGGLAFAVKKMAEAAGAIGISGTGEGLARKLDQRRAYWRGLNEERDKTAAAEADAVNKARSEARGGILGRAEDFNAARRENELLRAGNENERHAIKLRQLQDDLEIAQARFDVDKRFLYDMGDPIRQKRADESQLALQKAQNAILEEKNKKSETTRASQIGLTDREKIGAASTSMSAQAATTDAVKANGTVLKEIRDLVRRQQGGTFDGSF